MIAGLGTAAAGLLRGRSAAASDGLWQPETPSPEAFMRRALDLARTGAARGDGTPFGAVVVKEDRIVGEGWNRAALKGDPTAHAEVEAIQDACRRLGTRSLAGCALYTNGGRPCPMCETASYWAGIDRLAYGTSVETMVAGMPPRYGGCG